MNAIITNDFIKRNNKILIDWLSFTISDLAFEDLISLFGFESLQFTELRGNKGYSKKYYYDGVNINLGKTSDDMADYWVELSGQGCRVFETFGCNDWIYLLSKLLSFDSINVTRLDVAYDDFTGLISLPDVVADTLAGNYVSKASPKSWDVHLSGGGTCVTIGKSKSNTMIRLYDKAAERNAVDVDHWVRCEIQLRYANALAFCQMLVTHQVKMPVDSDGVFIGVSVDDVTIERLYFGVLNNYLRYIDKNANNDTNKWRKPCAEHWKNFAHSVTDEKISLWINPGVEYNILRLDHTVENMFSGAVATYVTIHGIDQLISKLVERLSFLNPKYRLLIAQHLKNQKCAPVLGGVIHA